MTDKLEQEAHDGGQAQFILTHPLVVRAFEDLESALNNALTDVSERDVEALKNIVITKKLLKKFRALFESHVNTGKLARRQLDEIARRGLADKARDRVRRFF